MRKQIVILLIGLAVLINAQIAIPPSLGTGTESDPYQIANLENLYWITADTLNFHSHYIQTADINAAETKNWFVGDHDDDPETPDEPMGWKPIGNLSDEYFAGIFDGTYDGQGHIIDSLYISRIPKSFDDESMTGLFGWTQNTEIKNLGVVNSTIIGCSNVGILAGTFSGTITSCYTSGNISGYWAVGGLFGEGSGNIEKCYSNVNVSGANYTGGLVGHLSGGIISSSSTSGSVSLLGEGSFGGTGGLVGTSEGNITNSYSLSDIYGESGAYGGGFVGHQEGGNIEDSFSFGRIYSDLSGGFEGSGYGNVVNCFWDTEASGVSTSYAGTGLTTAQMKNISTYTDAGWDFVGETANGTEDIWNMDGIHNNGYPYLRWMYQPVAIAPALGSGTSEDPYQIATLENLYWITADTLNFHSHYIQTADINAAETRNWFVGDHDNDPETPDEPKGWKPIGGLSEVEALGYFSGSYNGQNYIIDNIYINEITTSLSYSNTTVGLFGNTQNAILKNMRLTNVDITGIDAGGLTGLTYIDTIENCYVTGSVSGSWCTGGLIGEGVGTTLYKCHNSASVTGENNVGGIIGSDNLVSLNQCYNTGNITGTAIVGGLVGYQSGAATADIYNCFNIGNITGTEKVGGLIGKCHDTKSFFCYSTGIVTGTSYVGSLIGESMVGANLMNNCFWDIDTSCVPDTTAQEGYGTGLTTAQMKTLSTYTDAGWNFEDIWDMDGVHNNGYPFLAWMSTTGIDEDDILKPVEFALFQNYPNPFNPVTTIKFSIPKDQNVKLSVYNSNGQLVDELINKKLEKGSHSVQFNAERLNSGIYFYRLDTDGKSLVNKMLLIK
ncbi:TPA: hypothetical protein DCR49_12300 [Candidatus Delongbacteria bacterium]|nr:hypothetical protein [Candidatus Delongbacteria bacterium]